MFLPSFSTVPLCRLHLGSCEEFRTLPRLQAVPMDDLHRALDILYPVSPKSPVQDACAQIYVPCHTYTQFLLSLHDLGEQQGTYKAMIL
jgi:hypothetical protein